MKETGPIAEIDCKNTITEINHTEGIDLQNVTKMIMNESIIIHFRTMEIGENIKIVIRTNIGIKDSMMWIIFMVEIGHVTETVHTVETGTTPKNTKETGHTLEIDYMAEMFHMLETGHIVEIDCKTTVEMPVRRKIIDMREGLKTIIKTGTARIIIEIVTKQK